MQREDSVLIVVHLYISMQIPIYTYSYISVYLFPENKPVADSLSLRKNYTSLCSKVGILNNINTDAYVMYLTIGVSDVSNKNCI